jgi:hypothetical protein
VTSDCGVGALRCAGSGWGQGDGSEYEYKISLQESVSFSLFGLLFLAEVLMR